MTVAQLRAVLADAPDEAIVRVNLATIDGSARVLDGGEYLAPEQWGRESGVLLQIARPQGVIVNGERFAPGYTVEAARYEQRTRP